jgi:hypothetical protein
MELTNSLKNTLINFLKKSKKPDLIHTYLFYIEKRYKIKPVLFPKGKKIYQSLENLLKTLEKEGTLFRETEIKIQIGKQNVNEQTTKVYICPFTGKVFGNNTCPNPQDAIYDWVSKCPENKERIGGLQAKRFFVSEDPQIIKNYITPRREPITKVVFSSVITGKLFNTKKSILDDLKKNQIKQMSLFEVQNQNRFEIENSFLEFLQSHLNQEKITEFVEMLSNHDEFAPYLEKWVG